MIRHRGDEGIVLSGWCHFDRKVLAVCAGAGIALAVWPLLVAVMPRLIYNPSDSVPTGWYGVNPLVGRPESVLGIVEAGSVVLVSLPAEAALLAAQRRYLPARIPLLKHVAAVSPQEVCAREGRIHIDGRPSAEQRNADRLGRPLPLWRECRRLNPGELFLLSSSNADSYDSRYFGPVTASDVLGVAYPLSIEDQP